MKNPIVKIAAWFIPSEKNVMQNKHDILKLLFTDNTTKESIDLLDQVKADFASELSKRYMDAQIELATIEDFIKVNKGMFELLNRKS